MSLKWRLGLVVVAVAAVVAGFMPHNVLSGVERTATEVVQVAESPLAEPVTCLDATCGKGNVSPAAPTPAVVLAAVLGGLAVAALGTSAIRRHRTRVAALPAGERDPLLRPPQFS